MKIEIMSPAQGNPLPPVKWNFEQLKKEIQEGLSKYKGIVYTEQDVSAAKKDRAMLNNLAKAIDEKRKEMKAKYLEPYNQFELESKELIGLIKDQSNEIDLQVKAFDDSRKKEKMDQIKCFYEGHAGNISILVPYEKIHNNKWLNVSYSMSSIEKEILESLDRIKTSLNVISGIDEKWRSQIQDKYLNTLDLGAALSEKSRLEEQEKALTRYQESRSHSQLNCGCVNDSVGSISTEPKTAKNNMYKVSFVIWATPDQLNALKKFLLENEIKYGREM